MVISTKKDPFSNICLSMNNQVIERVSSVKFLGIYISDTLSWNEHVDYVCKKARKIIGYIHRAFNSASPVTRRLLYLALVQPILEYSSISWHPLNITLTNRLESTLRFACRVILQSWKLSHENLLLKADLPRLSKRRDIANLCHIFKIINHLCSSPNHFKPHPRPTLRNLNTLSLDTPFCRLTLSQRSFYTYTPTLWNYLPEEIVNCATLPAFKTALRLHLSK